MLPINRSTTDSNEFQTVHYVMLAGYLGAQLSLLAAYFDGSKDSLANEGSAAQIAAVTHLLGRAALSAVVAAGSEYASLRLTNNAFGLFSTPVAAYVNATCNLADRIIDKVTNRHQHQF